MQIELYTPHAKQLEVHQDVSRFKVVNFSRRAGKSTLAQNYILAPNPVADWPLQGALQKVGRYWIVAPTYTQAKSVYWNGLMFSKDPSDTTAIPKKLIAPNGINNSELKITLINGSTIELKGADNPDSLRGAEANGIIMDEFAFWANPEAWEYVLQPMLSTTNGWALIVSTPNGYNHFYDMAEYAKNHKGWGYHHGTIEDNPNIPDEEKTRLKEDMDEDTFAQEYMAEFRKMKGLVYPEFNRDIHVFDPFDEADCEAKIGQRAVPLGGSWALSIDPGLRDQLAVGFWFIDYDDNYYLMDTIYERNLDTDSAYRMIRQKMGSNYFSTKVSDSAAAQFIKDMNTLHNLGLTPVSKERDSIVEGIRLCRAQLKVQEGTGRPKLFVAKHNTSFIQEIEAYRYPPEEIDRNPKPIPIDANNHQMDQWRYVRLTLFQPNMKPVQKRKKLYNEVTGRVIGYEDEN